MTFQHTHPEEEAGSTTNCWHNSVLKSMDYESSAQWLVINFSKELMRFGLEADMGLIRCRLDNELVKTDRPLAFAVAWLDAVSRCWPIEEKMFGIPVYQLLLPAMYEFCYQAAYELKYMFSTEGVAQWARDYNDPQLCELLLKVDGALLKEMDTSLLTIQHYTSAIDSTPSAIQYVPTSELTEDMIENALYLDPKIIMHLDHKWQTPRNVESYLRECASQNAMVDIGFIRQDCYTVKSAILAVRLNKTAYSKLPNNLQNDAEIKRIHHKLHFYEIESTL